MSIIEAIILGIVQGLTEFLPISSSGHIELGKAILGVESADDITFTLLVHAATALSILVVFWKDIKELFFSIFSFQWNENTQYSAKIALSMLPAAFVGLFFEDQLNELFDGEIILVGCCLIATGFILFLTQLERKHRRSVNFLDAIIIGLAQAVAILPGISRSGSTISTALALGIEKEKATRFSFLMVLGLIAGASILKLKDLGEATQDTTFLPYLMGFLAAFVSGVLACTWMLNIVKRGKIVYFSAYCFLIGAIAIAFGFMQ